jgi:hypothetical protein
VLGVHGGVADFANGGVMLGCAWSGSVAGAVGIMVCRGEFGFDPGEHLLGPGGVHGIIACFQRADDVAPFGRGFLVLPECFEGEGAHEVRAEVVGVALLERLPRRQRLLVAAGGVEEFGLGRQQRVVAGFELAPGGDDLAGLASA